MGSRKIGTDLRRGHLGSDCGVLRLRQIDNGLGIPRGLAACFADAREQRFVEHSVAELLAPRVQGLALGYGAHSSLFWFRLRGVKLIRRTHHAGEFHDFCQRFGMSVDQRLSVVLSR